MEARMLIIGNRGLTIPHPRYENQDAHIALIKLAECIYHTAIKQEEISTSRRHLFNSDNTSNQEIVQPGDNNATGPFAFTSITHRPNNLSAFSPLFEKVG